MTSLSSAPQTSKSMIVTHNAGKPTAFSYSVTLIKNGTGKHIDIGRMVSDFNLYQSISNMSLCMNMTLADTAGAFVSHGIQPGDQIQIEMYKDQSDSRKINSTYTIMSIDSETRISNSKGRVYSISATDLSAVYNKKTTVNKAYNQTISDIVTDVCKQIQINPSNLHVDTTASKIRYIAHNDRAFNVIADLIPFSISAKYGEGQAYFFYQTHEGFYYLPLKGIFEQSTSANNVWNYILSTNMNLTGQATDDLFRIIDFERLRVANQGSRIAKGVFESEVVQYNSITRTINSQKYRYIDDYKKVQVINKNPIVDLNNNYNEWVTPESDGVLWKRNYVYSRPNANPKGIGATHSSTFAYAQAQIELLNQNVLRVQVNGNSSINVGDIFNVSSPELSGVTTPALDKFMNGNFLVGNLRHRMVSAGEQYTTIMDLFSDAPPNDIYTDNN